MAHILKMNKQISVQQLFQQGYSQRQIARILGVNRRTVGKYVSDASAKCTTKVTTGTGRPDEAKCATQPVEVTTGSRSRCEAFREVIGAMLELGLSAQRVYQDLVVGHGFAGSYSSVRRYVAKLRSTPGQRVWRVECGPGEELQVDFCLGAPIRLPNGKTRRTWVFRAVLGHSRKGYSEAVLRQDTESFLRVLENALRHFGGVPRLLNLDNLKAGVIKADWYDPAINPKLMEFCRHYGITPMPCRAHSPQHKGKVERGVAYVKQNALKGRVFDSLAAENSHLGHWEQNVADTRIHGTTRRQVAALFVEERPHLEPLPVELFACYREAPRRVQRDGFVEVGRAWYEAPPEYVGRSVWARWDGRTVGLYNERMEQIALHVRLEPGRFSRVLGVRGFCGTVAQTINHWQSRAEALGQSAGQWAGRAFGQRGAEAVRSVMGLCALKGRHRAADIDAACATAMAAASALPSYRQIKALLLEGLSAPEQGQMDFRENDPLIRPLEVYAAHVCEHGGMDPFP